jgi:hypothetical protein
MSEKLIPRGENLRRAVRWLSEHGPATRQVIEAASVRFDLSPGDEQFLLDYFRVADERDPRQA